MLVTNKGYIKKKLYLRNCLADGVLNVVLRVQANGGVELFVEHLGECFKIYQVYYIMITLKIMLRMINNLLHCQLATIDLFGIATNNARFI